MLEKSGGCSDYLSTLVEIMTNRVTVELVSRSGLDHNTPKITNFMFVLILD